MVNFSPLLNFAPSMVPQDLQKLSDDSSPLQSLVSFASNKDGLLNALSERNFSEANRLLLHDTISRQYQSIKTNAEFKVQIQTLLDPNTFTVTTGHQVCLAGGPLYFVIKLASVIKLAQQVQSWNTNRKVVPIFWMATEDHDFEEANHFFYQEKKYEYSSASQGNGMGRIPSNDALVAFEMLKKDYPEWSLSSFLLAVEKAYSQSEFIAEATRKLAHQWFGHLGLLCLDADDPNLKRVFLPFIKKELQESFSNEAVNMSNEEMQQFGIATQIQSRELNLFYFHENRRIRIDKVGELFVIGELSFSLSELLEIAEEFPERFSPNVVLRPLYQECILPNIAYVGGPSEIRYWMQLKHIFSKANIPFPVLIHRDNFVFIKKSSLHYLESQNIAMNQLGLNWDNLVKTWIQKFNKKDEYFESWKTRLTEEFVNLQKFENFGQKSKAFIPAAQKDFEKILKRLELRMQRDLKQEHEVELGKLKKIKSELYPKGVFQERFISIFDCIGLLGSDSFSELVNNCDPLNQDLKVLVWGGSAA